MQQQAGLYLHVPFCSSVCPYCDFAVLIAGEPRRRGFIDSVLREAESHRVPELRFDTVYFGGGTPSSLPEAELHELVQGLRSRLPVEDDAQLFLEINPEDVDAGRAAAWCEAGFSFVSLGVQSFDDRVLAALGRKHSAHTAMRAVDTLKAAGFHTVSVDLIFAVPGQSVDQWGRQLQTAVSLGVDHLACYQLTLHDGTVFGKQRDRGEFVEVADEQQAELFLLTQSVLADAGYPAYEVCNFAAAEVHRSRHNQKYWRHQPYLGLGPSAHSFVHRRRWWNRRKLRLWQSSVLRGAGPVEGEERLTDGQLLLEAIMLGIRTTEGVDLAGLSRRYDVDLQGLNEDLLERLEGEGAVRLQGSRLRPTARGMLLADGIARSIRI